jgi:RHS repeat-associated protein
LPRNASSMQMRKAASSPPQTPPAPPARRSAMARESAPSKDEGTPAATSAAGSNIPGRLVPAQAGIVLPGVGLLYYKTRMYSPLLGRFLQTDPIGTDGGMNVYGYVGGDPVNETYPWGLQAAPTDPGSIYVTGTSGGSFGGSNLFGVGAGFGLGSYSAYPGPIGLNFNPDNLPGLARFLKASTPQDNSQQNSCASVQASDGQGGCLDQIIVTGSTIDFNYWLSSNYAQNFYNQLSDSITFMAAGRGKGERGYTAKPSGTKKPFKHMKPDPNKPGNVIVRSTQTGKSVSKPAPPGYDPSDRNRSSMSAGEGAGVGVVIVGVICVIFEPCGAAVGSVLGIGGGLVIITN